MINSHNFLLSPALHLRCHMVSQRATRTRTVPQCWRERKRHSTERRHRHKAPAHRARHGPPRWESSRRGLSSPPPCFVSTSRVWCTLWWLPSRFVPAHLLLVLCDGPRPRCIVGVHVQGGNYGTDPSGISFSTLWDPDVIVAGDLWSLLSSRRFMRFSLGLWQGDQVRRANCGVVVGANRTPHHVHDSFVGGQCGQIVEEQYIGCHPEGHPHTWTILTFPFRVLNTHKALIVIAS